MLPRTYPLFEYGQLMTQGPYTAAARGEMRMRTKSDPCAQFGGRASAEAPGKGVVYGQVHMLTRERMIKLSKEERPQYMLKVIRLIGGRQVYAYAYHKADWEEKAPVPSGKFDEKTLRPEA